MTCPVCLDDEGCDMHMGCCGNAIHMKCLVRHMYMSPVSKLEFSEEGGVDAHLTCPLCRACQCITTARGDPDVAEFIYALARCSTLALIEVKSIISFLTPPSPEPDKKHACDKHPHHCRA